MQTLKRLTLLDAKKVQGNRIGKKAQLSILGGYGGYGSGGYPKICNLVDNCTYEPLYKHIFVTSAEDEDYMCNLVVPRDDHARCSDCITYY